MKKIIFIIANIFSFYLGYGQSHLTGRIIYHNSGEKPASGVEVSALGANSVFTEDHGIFTLTFNHKKSGDRVKLLIGNTDGKGKNIAIVNTRQLEILKIPSRPDDDLVEVFISPPDQLEASVKSFYGILERATSSEYDRKIDEIKKILKQNNLDSKATNTLVTQMEELRRERDNALAALEEKAAYIAAINKDRASEMVKTAIESIENEENIDKALEVLDNAKLEEAYKAALNKKTKRKPK